VEILIIAAIAIGFFLLGKSRGRRPTPQSRPPQVLSSLPPAVRRRALASSSGGLPPDFQLTPEFAQAFELMENSGQHIFITGKAGAGKSTLLQYFKQKTKKKVVVVAPTGIAAINVGGSTLHSMFQLPPRLVKREDAKFIPRKADVFKTLDAVVIDEVSMVRADVMDAIDQSLRVNRNQMEVPFGGAQMILIGDLYQLPPVVETATRTYFANTFESPFFFSANVFRATALTKLELGRIFRQSDPTFIELLNKVRNNQISVADLDVLNGRYRADGSNANGKVAITLTSTNAIAQTTNSTRLAELQSRPYNYEATITGDFDEKSYPTERRLTLKEGAQVMMVKNDPGKRWVNGSLGVVQRLSATGITVLVDGESNAIEPMTWEKIDYEYNEESGKIEPVVIGAFRQFPIKLAWAVTIHKSQGKTFDNVIIDLGNGAFAHGQAYVALSRCRSLEGISLCTRIKLSDVILDPRVVTFMSGVRVS
jgi:ATP-dependent DNA helicase PIF1